MTNSVFSDQDIQQIKERGISLEAAASQIAMLKRGVPFANLDRACTLGDGLLAIPSDQHDALIARFKKAAANGRATKFTPASGAATRMFKSLLAGYHTVKNGSAKSLREAAEAGDKDAQDFFSFFTNIKRFAFYEDLAFSLAAQGENIDDLLQEKSYHKIVEALVEPAGMNYANLPKGLIVFHRYPEGNRTAFEEHLIEGMAYAQDADGVVRLCFTISTDPESDRAARELIAAAGKHYEKAGITFDIQWMYQKPSTDTLAIDPDGNPFRETDGTLHFRPGGHGSLLENVKDVQGDIIFLKNIDNVVPDYLKAETYRYKMILGGYLIEIQEQIFRYLKMFSQEDVSDEQMDEMIKFSRSKLALDIPNNFADAASADKKAFLKSYLDRPLRICGMVKNQGEPGGGPFWVIDKDGRISLQLVESSQIDKSDDRQRQILESATHFSPVDIVCGVRNYQGQPFDLMEYRDPDACFISHKSYEGRELDALEHPGLWNGSMAFWNTIFVEVPLITFNPVKTVLDLLRKEHQPQ